MLQLSVPWKEGTHSRLDFPILIGIKDLHRDGVSIGVAMLANNDMENIWNGGQDLLCQMIRSVVVSSGC